MKKTISSLNTFFNYAFNHIRLGMRAKLIIVFLVVKIIPLIILAAIAWWQILVLGNTLRDIAVSDSSEALNSMATENIERLTTDTARDVADFLYARDGDILYLANLAPSTEAYRAFAEERVGRLITGSRWTLAPSQTSWLPGVLSLLGPDLGLRSTNPENNDRDGFHYRPPDQFAYRSVPLYDEITYLDLNGNELVKYVTPNSTKVNYPLSPLLRNIADGKNTYVKAERYFEKLQSLQPGEIYVSDVTGAYVGSNYIGMYTPDNLAAAAETRGYDIDFDPEAQAYAGEENPNGQRFEGIVRWATPTTDNAGNITGYVTFALNHDHIMEFVDHITPMNERYTELPSAFDGNYAFIWDYNCRSICHPRHHSIVGFNPETGEPAVPWLETSIYEAWQVSGEESWVDFVSDWPKFDAQSREKKPAAALTQAGMVGLDGRYLNNAPQCTGWMDLTASGGSGSFYILWSGLYKLTTAAAIPYYTGQYAPSEANSYSRRGFGFVAIGAGLEDFTHPATVTEQTLTQVSSEYTSQVFGQLLFITAALIMLVVIVAIAIASALTNNITVLIDGISRFKAGERQFRFHSDTRDEFGTLADSFDEMAENIVNSVNSPLSIIDMDRNVIYMNEPGLILCHKSLDQIVGTPYGESSLYPMGSVHCPITALQNGHEAEVLYLPETNTYIKGTANYLIAPDGEQIGYIVVSTDVTEIQLARNKAEQASRAKGDFLSNMSHEIRTPMNAIIGMTFLGKSSTELERKDYCLDKIENASNHLLGVINDILDMSKIEANKFEMSVVEFDFAAVLQDIAGVFSFRADEKHLDLSVVIDKNVPDTLVADDQRLTQVINNLLSNAIKFTPEYGSITLSARLIDEQDDLCTIQISVADTGIGIDEVQQTRVFNLFEQAESSTSRRYGGTGLGLAISKRIVELMGGTIWIESKLGEGATFLFTIRAVRGGGLNTQSTQADTDKETQADACFKDYHILLAEDVEVNREIVLAVLEPTGLTVDCAENGAQAVRMFTENPGTYDVIFMDVQMPEMDGYEATQKIRAMEAPEGRQVPIIAMTANVFREDIEKCLACGMNDHVGKPLDFGEIMNKLRTYLLDRSN